jgi:hypothetical protein
LLVNLRANACWCAVQGLGLAGFAAHGVLL